MKIAIVGCGQIADAHIQEASKLPDINISAVCDLNRHMAKQAAIRFKIPKHYNDIDKMMAEVRPDVVHVTTPPTAHLFLGKKILSGGAHIYMEKPFTLNLEQAEELVFQANKIGKLICIGHNAAFDPVILRLRDANENGDLGDLVHIDTLMGYSLEGPFGKILTGDPNHWVHQLPGGLLQNTISHPLSFITSLTTGKPEVVTAFGFRRRTNRYSDIRDKFFDELRVILKIENTTAHLVFTSHGRPIQLSATVFGTKCTVEANTNSRSLRFTNGAEMPGPFAKIQWAYRDMREATRELRRHLKDVAMANLHFFEGMKELFRQFYSAIDGKGSMPITMNEALTVTETMDEIFRKCQISDTMES